MSLFILCILSFLFVNASSKNAYKPTNTKNSSQKAGYSKSSVVKSDTDAFKYLTRFGYNQCQNGSGSRSQSSDDILSHMDIASMLESFQIKYHLPMTKKLDATTLKLMNTPRCGLPDSPPQMIDRGKLW